MKLLILPEGWANPRVIGQAGICSRDGTVCSFARDGCAVAWFNRALPSHHHSALRHLLPVKLL